MTHAQQDPTGRLRHLLSLQDLPAESLLMLLDRAQAYCAPAGHPAPRNTRLAGRTVANLFFEPSTRTRASFELAARRLGAEVLNLDISLSSATKGESVLDTLDTLLAMGVDAFVVRHADDGLHAMLADFLDTRAALINAGEGASHHPTQGLLDALTIRQHKPAFEPLTVTIAGDIRHSRVAHSAVHALSALGVGELRLASPTAVLADNNLPGKHFTDLDQAVQDADVIMMLRIQKERMAAEQVPDTTQYLEHFGLTPARLARAKPDAIVMHPGPMNRGVEIADSVADGPQSVIRQQVANGVAVRMAVLEALLADQK